MDSNRKRLAAANIAAAGFITVGAAVALSATAAADPPPPEPLPAPGEPAPPPPPPGPTVPVVGAPLGPAGFNVLGQNGEAPVPGALGAPPVVGLDRDTVLGQNALPSAPGAGPGVVPSLNPFNNAYGPQEYVQPSAPGQGEQFDVAPGDENADVTRREWLGRYIDMYRAGMLKGWFNSNQTRPHHLSCHLRHPEGIVFANRVVHEPGRAAWTAVSVFRQHRGRLVS
jgi:hypothetical protein